MDNSYNVKTYNTNSNPLNSLSFRFSVEIIHLYQKMKETNEYVLSRQILRSGTSVGAMIREAKNAESPADFIHKLGIAQKEADETIYWLELLRETNYIDESQFKTLYTNASEILRMLRSSILTSKQKNNSQKKING